MVFIELLLRDLERLTGALPMRLWSWPEAARSAVLRCDSWITSHFSRDKIESVNYPLAGALTEGVYRPNDLSYSPYRHNEIGSRLDAMWFSGRGPGPGPSRQDASNIQGQTVADARAKDRVERNPRRK